MRAIFSKCCSIILLSLVLFSCKKETETIDGQDYQTERLTEMLPLQVGKYITYRLDSTVFTQHNSVTEIHSYQEKDIVDAQITDNLGRPSYRVFRFIRDIAGLESWVTAGTYFITPTSSTVEITEDNLRVVSLTTPVRQDITWKGNLYLPMEPYKSLYSFSENNFNNWDFKYNSLNDNIELNGNTISDVAIVTRVDESVNVPITAATPYASVTYAVDKYAKGIGLVYQELTIWEYQQNLGGSPYTTGFGVKRSMTDHN